MEERLVKLPGHTGRLSRNVVADADEQQDDRDTRPLPTQSALERRPRVEVMGSRGARFSGAAGSRGVRCWSR
jgi:hypothetical protein